MFNDKNQEIDLYWYAFTFNDKKPRQENPDNGYRLEYLYH